MSDFTKNSFLFGPNSVFIEELYLKYLSNPNSVDESWQNLFSDLMNDVINSSNPSWHKQTNKIILSKDDFEPKLVNTVESNSALELISRLKAQSLIEAYRNYGHYLADLDPLKLEKIRKIPHLEIEQHGFNEQDLEVELNIEGLFANFTKLSLRELINKLKEIYASQCGAEFNHIENQEAKIWLQYQLENINQQPISLQEQQGILQDLIEVVGFENFLHNRFPGAKRFSIEGLDTVIIAVESIIKMAAVEQLEEIVIGMAHRGRLNMLTKVLKKSYQAMFSEFQGNLANPAELDLIMGDVKYHLGKTTKRQINDKSITISLTANPSHLEAVNPVVMGKVRAKQDQNNDQDRQSIMGLLLHGDAAFIGQGVVAESLMLSELEGYQIGGIIHIVTNNQIGFTTNPNRAKSGRYATEFAKITKLPIIHINADNPELIHKISKIALLYRQKFKQDIVLDIVGYRLYGHNEGDEPNFTQPLMYNKINDHTNIMARYASKLIKEQVVTEAEFNKQKEAFKSLLEQQLTEASGFIPKQADWLTNRWSHLVANIDSNQINTGLTNEKINKLGIALTQYPKDFVINSKISRQLELKKKMFQSEEKFDWATAEALAFASLLVEKKAVRLSGQDVSRGTFSHRHSVLIDQQNENHYIPLNNLTNDQAKYEVINSNLSEFAVLGFEYGYSQAEPDSLIIWEAQFGDFANGAQVIIDQFITSGQTKWLRMSGLVMLLPHGFEGQGPEHSSARLERFLQLCADDNIQVVNCSTPASYFHVLRRQLSTNYRRPLIIMSPKSLLRHKLAVSSYSEFTEDNKFLPVISQLVVENQKINKILLCSGKIYYELAQAKETQQIMDTIIIRIEQLYPFPEQILFDELSKYPNARLIWVQEEPKNMGSYSFIKNKFEESMITKLKNSQLAYIGRKEAASPAVGYLKVHNQEQALIIAQAFSQKI